MPSSEQSYSGLLVVNKPGLPFHPQAAPTGDGDRRQAPTSHDIVQMVRRWSGQRRIGHTGTLDPMASGVLVLCLGKATRLVEYYQGHAKTYLAGVKLGTATETYDAMGRVAAQAPIPELDEARLEAVLTTFRGDIMQTPPIFSALKQGGESVHRKARRGEKVVLRPRPITVHELNLVDWNGKDRIDLRIRCSAGTYVRSLAHDLGMSLGTVAHLEALQRKAAGSFSLTDAHDPERIAAAAADGQLNKLIVPPGTGLDMPAIVLSPGEVKLLGYGQELELSSPDAATIVGAPLARAYADDGRFVGIIGQPAPCSSHGESRRWKAKKWFGLQ